MTRIEIRCLGTFQVLIDGTPVTAFESNRVRALLVYLATEVDRSHHREALAGLIWSEMPDRSALANLRNTLSHLRKAIGDRSPSDVDNREEDSAFLLISRDSVQFNPTCDSFIDVVTFDEQIGAARAKFKTDDNRQSAINALQSALELYQGEFLAGISLADSNPFEEWVSLRREQLHRQALQALHDLTLWHEAAGEIQKALSAAYRQVDLEPWLEEGHQQVMRLLALNGQRSQALAQYETCRNLLAEQMGVDPAAETTHLYEIIRDGKLDELASIHPGERIYPPAPGEPPYKGLLYFDEADAHLFFGREQVTTRLVGHVNAMISDIGEEDSTHFLSVVGASGSGKSSIVRAGLVPALKSSAGSGVRPALTVHILTPTTHPLEALAVHLTRSSEPVTAKAALMDDMTRDDFSLNLFIKGQTSAQRVLLIIDQFEELFTLCRSEEERSAFVNNLLVAARDAARVVIALRADFYAHCAQYPRLRQALCERQEYIGPMDAAELRRAIEAPAHHGDWQFEPGLVELILRDVGAGEGHSPEPGALPLLSHALLETWKRRSGRTLTFNGYAEAGGVHRAIAHTAETVFNQLDAAHQSLARKIFLRLTKLGEGTQDTRRRVPLSELLSTPEQQPVVQDLLKTLADTRLVTLSEDTAEVAHEVLIREWPLLREWLAEDRAGLLVQHHLTESVRSWHEHGCDAGELFRGARLAQVLEWMSVSEHAAELNRLEMEFVQASRETAEHEAVEREAQRLRELKLAEEKAEAERLRAEEQTCSAARLRRRAVLLAAALLVAALLAVAAGIFGQRSSANASGAQTAQARAVTQQGAAEAASTRAVVEKNKAEDLAARNLAENLAATGLNQRSKVSLSLLLAAESFQRLDNYRTRGSLLELLNHPNLQQVIYGNQGGVLSLVFSQDGSLLYTGGGDGTIRTWDFASNLKPGGMTHQQIGEPLLGHTGEVSAIALSPDGKILASGGADKTIILWDLVTRQRIGEPLTGHSQNIVQVAFSPDGKTLASTTDGAEIILWDIVRDNSGGVNSRPNGYTLVDKSCGAGFAFSPDGKILAAGGCDNSITLWDRVTRSVTGKIPIEDVSWNTVYSLVFSPDGKILAAATNVNYSINLYDAATLEKIGTLDYLRVPLSLAFSPDGKTLASGSEDGVIKLWDVATQKAIGDALTGHTSNIHHLAFSPDGRTLVSGGASPDGSIILWDISRKRITPIRYPLMGHSPDAMVLNVAFSPDGTKAASVDGYGIKIIWDLASREPIGSPIDDADRQWAFAIAFSPDSKILAASRFDNTIIFYDVATHQRIGQPLTGHTDLITDIAFSPDGRTLVSSSLDTTLIVYDVATHQPIQSPLKVHGETVLSGLAFSPDGKLLASGGGDGKVVLLDTVNYRLNGDSLVYGGSVYALSFSWDGKMLAASGSNLAIVVWDVTTRRKIGQPLVGHTTTSESPLFSPDGKTLYSGSWDRTIIVWDLTVFQAVGQPLNTSQDSLQSMAISPDGKILASVAYADQSILDGTVMLWDMDPQSWLAKACQIAGRNLTRAEWAIYLGDEPYRKTCAQWSEGE